MLQQIVLCKGQLNIQNQSIKANETFGIIRNKRTEQKTLCTWIYVCVMNAVHSSGSLSLQKDDLNLKIQGWSKSMMKTLWTAYVLWNIKVH